MLSAFVDTSFNVAMLNSRDADHEAARRVLSSLQRPLVTTEYVLVETGNWLAGVGDRATFVRLVTRIHADPNTQVIAASSDLLARGVALYSERSDKDWGLTDCLSFIVMRDLGLIDALSADRHFQQAGFRAMLLED